MTPSQQLHNTRTYSSGDHDSIKPTFHIHQFGSNGRMANVMDENKTTSAIDLISGTFYVEKSFQQLPSRIVDVFEHPFDSRILLNTSSVDASCQESVERVLNIGRSERTSSDSIPDCSLTVDDELATYLALPSQVKHQLRDMFMKARLTVESKPRGSVDRKLSYASTSSHKHAPIINIRRKKSRKLSNVSHCSQLSDWSRRNPSIVDFSKECRKGSGSHQRTLASTDQSSLNNSFSQTTPTNRDLKFDVPSSKNDREADFFVTPIYYNSLRERNAQDDVVEVEEDEIAETNSFAWSKRENARRKVTRWLRKSH